MAEALEVRYFDGDAALNGMFAWPSCAPERRPGVLVVHGGAGLDDHARGRARRFADAGYLAFACDMYGEAVRGHRDRIMQQIGELRGNRAALSLRVGAAIGMLKEHPQCDGRVVMIGYCLGGLVALESARAGLDLSGVVCVHGNLSTAAPAQAGSIKARILVCHGSRDPHAPASQVPAFVDEMNLAGADYQLVIYGGAMHGFTHETATEPANGVAYDATADRRSSIAIKTFLDDLFVAP